MAYYTNPYATAADDVRGRALKEFGEAYRAAGARMCSRATQMGEIARMDLDDSGAVATAKRLVAEQEEDFRLYVESLKMLVVGSVGDPQHEALCQDAEAIIAAPTPSDPTSYFFSLAARQELRAALDKAASAPEFQS